MLMNWAKYTVSPTRRLSKGADTSPQLNKQFTESQQHLVRRRLGIQEYAVLQWFVLETPHVRRSTSMVNSTINLWKLGKSSQFSEVNSK